MSKESDQNTRVHNARAWLKIVFILAVLVVACTPALPSESHKSGTAPPQSTPALETDTFPTVSATPGFYSSAPEGSLDTTCRITINFFFDFKKGSDVAAYRRLFLIGNGSLADIFVDHPPMQSRTILVLMPASAWWQKLHPATPIPGALLPEGSNEYTYVVEYTGYYDSDETPFYAYPDYMTMIMVSDGPFSCKIKNYGKG